MIILLGDLKAKVERERERERERIFSNQQWGMRVYNRIVMMMMLVNFPTSKNLVVKSTVFAHRNIHKYTCTSHDGQTRNQIDQILIDRRWHSNILDILFFWIAGCDAHHYLVVAEVREIGKIGSK